MVEPIETAIKLIIGLGVLSVWLLRANRPSPWRGGNAKSLQEEFKVYGLSPGAMRIVGGIKILLALVLIASIFIKPIEHIGAIGMAVMMLAAIFMHVKIKDELKRSLPAFVFFCLSLILILA